MKNKKILFIIVIAILIVIITFIVLNITKKENDKKPINEEKQLSDNIKNTENLNKALMENSKLSTLKKYVGTDISSDFVLVGDNSYLRLSPLESLIKKYDMENYLKAQKKYASKVENKIKNTFEYTIDNSLISVDGATVVPVTFKSYNYALYISDLQSLMNLLQDYLSQADKNKMLSNKEFLDITTYKLKVKSMEILDNYLNNYDNDEYVTREIIYEEGKIEESSSSILSYIYSIQGGNLENTENQKDRLTGYIEESINNNILFKEEILKLAN